MRFFAHWALLFTIPNMVLHPLSHFPHISAENHYEEEWVCPTTYDEILQLLDDLESGVVEETYSPSQLERVNTFLALLAQEGILPGEEEQEIALQEDIHELMHPGEQLFHLAGFEQSGAESIARASGVPHYSSSIVRCGLRKKCKSGYKATKAFAKKHKKELIIGGVILASIGCIVIGSAVISSYAGGAAAAASSARSSSPPPSSRRNTSSSKPSLESISSDSSSTKEKTAFKEFLAKEGFFTSSTQEGLSFEETGRVLGSTYAHHRLDSYTDNLGVSPEFQQIAEAHGFALSERASCEQIQRAHSAIDAQFVSNYTPHFSNPQQTNDLTAISYRMRGEAAQLEGYHDQALEDFTRVIDRDPSDSSAYLSRGISYYLMGMYERGLEDYHKAKRAIAKGLHATKEASTAWGNKAKNGMYAAKEFSVTWGNKAKDGVYATTDFSMAFTKGLGKGLSTSLRGWKDLGWDMLTAPIETSRLVGESCAILAKHTWYLEGKKIAHMLSPEVMDLLDRWDELTLHERGLLAGHAFGKHGADILAPCGAAKAARRGAKIAKEMRILKMVNQNLRRAEATLALETYAATGSPSQAAKMLRVEKNTLCIGKELGLSGIEINQLKHAGKLETTLQNKLAHLSLPQKESLALFTKAQQKLKLFKGRYLAESEAKELIHQTGLPTLSRPKGVPGNYRVKISDKGGVVYIHPENSHTSVRVMPGKPHSPWPHQQKPYVVQMQNGKAFDKFGNKVAKNTPEAHIPLDEFIYNN